MASYDAVVNLSVVGTSRLERVNAAVGQLNTLTRQLNSNLNLLAPGAGKLGDKLRQAFEPIKNFAREAANGTAKLANTLAGAAAQADAISTALNNVKVQAGGLDAQVSTVKNLSAAWLETALNVQRYQKAQEELQASQLATKGLMQLSGGEIVRGTEAGVGVQGPRLPGSFDVRETRNLMELPAGTPRLAAPGLRGIQGAMSKPGMADAIIGAGFPALFGGGPGAMIGGGLGGLAGGAMGGQLGMALSIGLSAVGQKLDQIFGEAIRATQELGQALSRLDVEKLRESAVMVTAELENQVRLLVESGKYEEARALMAGEVTMQTGALGTTTADSANAVNLLKNAWDNVLKPVQSILSIIVAPFAAALAGVLNALGLAAKGVNYILSGIGQLIKGATEWVIKLFGGQKALDAARNGTKAASEEQAKLNAAVQAKIDAGFEEFKLSSEILELEKQRVAGSNRIAEAANIEVDRLQEIARINSDLEKEKKQIYDDNVGANKELVEQLIAQAEADAQNLRTKVNITAELRKQKNENDAIIAGLQDQADAAKNQAENYALVNSSATKILQIEEQRLQQRLQFATSLNQESALIDRITANRKQQAEVEYQAQVRSAQAAVEDAARQYDIVKTKHAAKQVDDEALNTAIRNLNTAVLSRDVETQIAGLKREQGLETAEIQGRQKQLNAYAEDYKRTNESISRELDAQSNALSNRASLLSAISQATQTINNIEIESLTRELERTSSVREREKILEKIYRLEVENAKAVLQATRAQIQAELQRAEVAYRKVLLEQKMLEAVVAIAKAQGIVMREHYEALKIQEDALAIAKHNVDTAVQIADVQWKAADAVFKAAVDAAKLKKEMGGVADAAGQFAGNMERAASAAGAMVGTPFAVKGGAEEIQDPALKAQAQKIWQEAEAFAATKGIASIQADILQRARDAIARIAFRDYTLRTKAATSTVSAPATITSTATAPSTTPIPTTQPLAAGLSMQPGGGAGTAIVDRMPTINLQTGPVLQQEDGSKYVSLGDLEKILQDFATVVFNNARSAGGRRFQGVN